MTARSHRRRSGGTAESGARERRAHNINEIERGASAFVGGVLLLAGLRRRSPGGWLTALVGGLLVLRGLRGHSPLYEALDVDTAELEPGGDGESAGPTEVERSVTVGRPAEELDDLWRDPVQMNRVVGDSVDVRSAGEDRQRWTVQAPLGRQYSWEMRLVDDEPGEHLRWESPPDATVPTEASVRFREAPADRGTVVTLRVSFDPPGGAVGAATVDRLGIVPKALVGTALARFKSLAETGEIPSIDRNPSGRGRGDTV